jgi:hypothetical protein
MKRISKEVLEHWKSVESAIAICLYTIGAKHNSKKQFRDTTKFSVNIFIGACSVIWLLLRGGVVVYTGINYAP